MEFVKLEDARKVLENLRDTADVYECIGAVEKFLDGLKVYKADYVPHMPIRIRDYGYMPDGEPHEFDCGADQNHHWLKIQDDGSLQFTHMQNGSGTMDEEYAKIYRECCFVPNYEHENELGIQEGFITPECLLVIDEGE